MDVQLDAILLDDDADQGISDDGEIPVYQPGADSDDEMEDGSDSSDGHGAEEEGVLDEGADSGNEAGHPSRTSKPAASSSTWKAPTTEELANIKAASELFKSNAFKLKVRYAQIFSSVLFSLVVDTIGLNASSYSSFRSKPSFLKSDQNHPRNLQSNRSFLHYMSISGPFHPLNPSLHCKHSRTCRNKVLACFSPNQSQLKPPTGKLLLSLHQPFSSLEAGLSN